MHSFLSKVFGRKKAEDKPTSPTTLVPGELLDGKFEAVSPTVSPSANFLELDSNTDANTNGNNGNNKEVGFSKIFRAKSRISSPEVNHKKLDTLPHLSLNFRETREEVARELGFLLDIDSQTNDLLSDAIIGQRRLNPLEALVLIQACSKAITSRGLETLGIMHPHWYSSSPDVQRRLISNFQQSLTFQESQDTGSPVSPTSPTSLFESELSFTRSPHDIAAVLRWGLRHLQIEGDSFGTDDGWYKSFLDAEAAADYPPKSFSEKLAPALPPAHLDLLTATLEIFSSLAAHAEANSTSGSKLCKIFGLWLLTARRIEDKDDWFAFYSRWERTGRMLEHIFLARIRDESTDQRIPVRLQELVRKYPYTQGLSSPTTDLRLLPPPRFTTHNYDALFVRIEVEFPKAGLRPKSKMHPLNLLADAFSTQVAEGEYAELWTKIITASRNGSNPSPLSNIFADETIRFLSLVPDERAAKRQDKSPIFSIDPVSSVKKSFSESAQESSVASTSRRRQAASEPSPTPVSPSAIGSDWVQFSSSGFLDSSPAIGPLVSTLFDTDIEKTTPPAVSLSRKSSKRLKRKSNDAPRLSIAEDRVREQEVPAQDIKPVVKASKLEIIQFDEAFIDFWSDSLLDPITAAWPTFIICKFKSTLVPSLLYGPIVEGQQRKTLKWLVLEQVYTVQAPPTPVTPTTVSATAISSSPPPTEAVRPVSPSPSTKKRFNFFSRSISASSIGSLKGKKKEKSVHVGEMGELVEEDNKRESEVESPATNGGVKSAEGKTEEHKVDDAGLTEAAVATAVVGAATVAAVAAVDVHKDAKEEPLVEDKEPLVPEAEVAVAHVEKEVMPQQVVAEEGVLAAVEPAAEVSPVEEQLSPEPEDVVVVDNAAAITPVAQGVTVDEANAPTTDDVVEEVTASIEEAVEPAHTKAEDITASTEDDVSPEAQISLVGDRAAAVATTLDVGTTETSEADKLVPERTTEEIPANLSEVAAISEELIITPAAADDVAATAAFVEAEGEELRDEIVAEDPALYVRTNEKAADQETIPAIDVVAAVEVQPATEEAFPEELKATEEEVSPKSENEVEAAATVLSHDCEAVLEAPSVEETPALTEDVLTEEGVAASSESIKDAVEPVQVMTEDVIAPSSDNVPSEAQEPVDGPTTPQELAIAAAPAEEEQVPDITAAEDMTTSALVDKTVSQVTTEETAPVLDATSGLGVTPTTEEPTSDEVQVVGAEQETASVHAEEASVDAENRAQAIVRETSLDSEDVATIPVEERAIPDDPAPEGEPTLQAVAVIEEQVATTPVVVNDVSDAEMTPIEADFSVREDEISPPAIVHSAPIEQQVKPVDAAPEVEDASISVSVIDEVTTTGAGDASTEEATPQESTPFENAEGSAVLETVPVPEDTALEDPSSDNAIVAASVTGVAVASDDKEEFVLDAEVTGEAAPSVENDIEVSHQVNAIVAGEVKPVEGISDESMVEISPGTQEHAEALDGEAEQQAVFVEQQDDGYEALPAVEAPVEETVDEDAPHVEEESAAEDVTPVVPAEPEAGSISDKKEEDVEVLTDAEAMEKEIERDGENSDNRGAAIDTAVETVPAVERREAADKTVVPPAAFLEDQGAAAQGVNEQADEDDGIVVANTGVENVDEVVHNNKEPTIAVEATIEYGTEKEKDAAIPVTGDAVGTSAYDRVSTIIGEQADEAQATAQSKSVGEEAAIEEVTGEDMASSDDREAEVIVAPVTKATAQILPVAETTEDNEHTIVADDQTREVEVPAIPLIVESSDGILQDQMLDEAAQDPTIDASALSAAIITPQVNAELEDVVTEASFQALATDDSEVPHQDVDVEEDAAMPVVEETKIESVPQLEVITIPATEDEDGLAPVDEAAFPGHPITQAIVEVITPVADEGPAIQIEEIIGDEGGTVHDDEVALPAAAPVAEDEQSPSAHAHNSAGEVITGEDISDDNTIAGAAPGLEGRPTVNSVLVDGVERSAGALENLSVEETDPTPKTPRIEDRSQMAEIVGEKVDNENTHGDALADIPSNVDIASRLDSPASDFVPANAAPLSFSHGFGDSNVSTGNQPTVSEKISIPGNADAVVHNSLAPGSDKNSEETDLILSSSSKATTGTEVLSSEQVVQNEFSPASVLQKADDATHSTRAEKHDRTEEPAAEVITPLDAELAGHSLGISGGPSLHAENIITHADEAADINPKSVIQEEVNANADNILDTAKQLSPVNTISEVQDEAPIDEEMEIPTTYGDPLMTTTEQPSVAPAIGDVAFMFKTTDIREEVSTDAVHDGMVTDVIPESGPSEATNKPPTSREGIVEDHVTRLISANDELINTPGELVGIVDEGIDNGSNMASASLPGEPALGISDLDTLLHDEAIENTVREDVENTEHAIAVDEVKDDVLTSVSGSELLAKSTNEEALASEDHEIVASSVPDETQLVETTTAEQLPNAERSDEDSIVTVPKNLTADITEESVISEEFANGFNDVATEVIEIEQPNIAADVEASSPVPPAVVNTTVSDETTDDAGRDTESSHDDDVVDDSPAPNVFQFVSTDGQDAPDHRADDRDISAEDLDSVIAVPAPESDSFAANVADDSVVPTSFSLVPMISSPVQEQEPPLNAHDMIERTTVPPPMDEQSAAVADHGQSAEVLENVANESLSAQEEPVGEMNTFQDFTEGNTIASDTLPNVSTELAPQHDISQAGSANNEIIPSSPSKASQLIGVENVESAPVDPVFLHNITSVVTEATADTTSSSTIADISLGNEELTSGGLTPTSPDTDEHPSTNEESEPSIVSEIAVADQTEYVDVQQNVQSTVGTSAESLVGSAYVDHPNVVSREESTGPSTDDGVSLSTEEPSVGDKQSAFTEVKSPDLTLHNEELAMGSETVQPAVPDDQFEQGVETLPAQEESAAGTPVADEQDFNNLDPVTDEDRVQIPQIEKEGSERQPTSEDADAVPDIQIPLQLQSPIITNDSELVHDHSALSAFDPIGGPVEQSGPVNNIEDSTAAAPVQEDVTTDVTQELMAVGGDSEPVAATLTTEQSVASVTVIPVGHSTESSPSQESNPTIDVAEVNTELVHNEEDVSINATQAWITAQEASDEEITQEPTQLPEEQFSSESNVGVGGEAANANITESADPNEDAIVNPTKNSASEEPINAEIRSAPDGTVELAPSHIQSFMIAVTGEQSTEPADDVGVHIQDPLPSSEGHVSGNGPISETKTAIDDTGAVDTEEQAEEPTPVQEESELPIAQGQVPNTADAAESSALPTVEQAVVSETGIALSGPVELSHDETSSIATETVPRETNTADEAEDIVLVNDTSDAQVTSHSVSQVHAFPPDPEATSVFVLDSASPEEPHAITEEVGTEQHSPEHAHEKDDSESVIKEPVSTDSINQDGTPVDNHTDEDSLQLPVIEASIASETNSDLPTERLVPSQDQSPVIEDAVAETPKDGATLEREELDLVSIAELNDEQESTPPLPVNEPLASSEPGPVATEPGTVELTERIDEQERPVTVADPDPIANSENVLPSVPGDQLVAGTDSVVGPGMEPESTMVRKEVVEQQPIELMTLQDDTVPVATEAAILVHEDTSEETPEGLVLADTPMVAFVEGEAPEKGAPTAEQPGTEADQIGDGKEPSPEWMSIHAAQNSGAVEAPLAVSEIDEQDTPVAEERPVPVLFPAEDISVTPQQPTISIDEEVTQEQPIEVPTPSTTTINTESTTLAEEIVRDTSVSALAEEEPLDNLAGEEQPSAGNQIVGKAHLEPDIVNANVVNDNVEQAPLTEQERVQFGKLSNSERDEDASETLAIQEISDISQPSDNADTPSASTVMEHTDSGVPTIPEVSLAENDLSTQGPEDEVESSDAQETLQRLEIPDIMHRSVSETMNSSVFSAWSDDNTQIASPLSPSTLVEMGARVDLSSKIEDFLISSNEKGLHAFEEVTSPSSKGETTANTVEPILEGIEGGNIQSDVTY